MAENTNNNEALLTAAKKFAETEFHDLDTNGESHAYQVASVPDGRKLQSLKSFFDEYRTRPERKSGTSTLTTIESFVAQVNHVVLTGPVGTSMDLASLNVDPVQLVAALAPYRAFTEKGTRSEVELDRVHLDVLAHRRGGALPSAQKAAK